MQNGFGPRQRTSASPFPLSNRNKDGTWEAPLADRDNILGTSVDPHEPMWPRWKKTPPLHHEGDFISDDPFFDIDEISGKAEFYPRGGRYATAMSAAIPRGASGLTISPPAIPGDGDFWSSAGTTSAAMFNLQPTRKARQGRRQVQPRKLIWSRRTFREVFRCGVSICSEPPSLAG
jgi:hypothetical protein